MGLGGLITGIMGATGNSPTISTPNIGQVGGQFGDLLQTYLNYQPNIFKNEQEFQPQYNRLFLNNQTATRTQNVADAAALSPGMSGVLRSYNPTSSGLLDTLGSQAATQLSYNGGLDPALQRNVQQATRTAQAARGLGYGPGDVAEEQFYTNQTQEQRRQQNQGLASNVAGQAQNFYGDPFARLMGITTPTSVTPQIVSPNQSDSMLGTVYNATAAANIGNANAQTAMLQGFNSLD